MPVPFEALIPYAIIVTVSSTGSVRPERGGGDRVPLTET